MGAAGAIVVATGPDEPADAYVAALVACGAPPGALRVVDASAPHAAPGELLRDAAGLVLCGGVDVAPERYGEAELAEAHLTLDRGRDAFELELLGAAEAARVPTLAICRGLQVANVHLGGSLFQDLPAQHASGVAHAVDPQRALAHAVFVEAVAHPMADLLRRAPCIVNSAHHQAVRRLAPALVPIARSADDLVEAAALPADHPWWLWGVQWHPEDLVELPLQRALWHAFMAAASARPAPVASGAR